MAEEFVRRGKIADSIPGFYSPVEKRGLKSSGSAVSMQSLYYTKRVKQCKDQCFTCSY